jgi:hypothetical protein
LRTWNCSFLLSWHHDVESAWHGFVEPLVSCSQGLQIGGYFEFPPLAFPSMKVEVWYPFLGGENEIAEGELNA